MKFGQNFIISLFIISKFYNLNITSYILIFIQKLNQNSVQFSFFVIFLDYFFLSANSSPSSSRFFQAIRHNVSLTEDVQTGVALRYEIIVHYLLDRVQ